MINDFIESFGGAGVAIVAVLGIVAIAVIWILFKNRK